MRVVNFNTRKSQLTFVTSSATGPLLPLWSVTQEQIPSILLTVGGNKEEDVGKLSPPQLFNQSGHV